MVCHYAECHDAEYHNAEFCYAECRYAECRGAGKLGPVLFNFLHAEFTNVCSKLELVPARSSLMFVGKARSVL